MRWIQTYCGTKFKFNLILKENISIEDIAHSLSLQCRFNGHCRYFYSVAEHSVRTMDLCLSEENKKYALLHDASESYISDLPRPFKNTKYASGYVAYEKEIQTKIYEKFRLNPFQPKEISIVDNIMLIAEARCHLKSTTDKWDIQIEESIAPEEIKSRGGIPVLPTPWEPKEAEKIFLLEFKKLNL